MAGTQNRKTKSGKNVCLSCRGKSLPMNHQGSVRPPLTKKQSDTLGVRADDPFPPLIRIYGD
jgi:hypothetical protein